MKAMTIINMVTFKKVRRVSYLLAGTTFFLTMLQPLQVSAASITMSLSPSQTSVQQGNNFTITAQLSTGSAKILDILATVNYEASIVQYISTSYSPSSSWGSPGPEANDGGSGYKRLDVIKNDTAPSGNLPVATLTFKALVGSGSAEFSISDASSGDGDNPPPAVHTVSTNGTTVSFTTPSSSSSSNNSQTNTSPGLPSEQAVQINSELDDSTPVPASGYQDEAGYLVDILVLDKEGKPVAGTDVTLGDHAAVTGSNGIASFSGILAGTYLAKALGIEQEVTVETGDPTIIQEHALTQSHETNWLTYVFIGAAGLGALALVAFLWSKFKGGKWGGKGKQSPENVAFVGGSPPPPATPPTSPLSTDPKIIHPGDNQ